MTAEPIRSALSAFSTEDTSLVLPASDKNQRTGQQRVLEQVNTIKRGKSKMVKNDSIPSPTTPASMTEYSEPKFQFSPVKLNDTLFKFSGSTMTSNASKVTGRSLSVRNTVRRQTQNSQYESRMNWNAQPQSNGMRRSGSDPALGKASSTIRQKSKMKSTVRYNRATGQSMRLQENNLLSSTSQSQVASIKPSLSQSQTISKVTTTKSKSEALDASGAEGSIPNITMEEAVKYLSHSDISYKIQGASYIQHHTFTEDSAKQEVWRLNGIYFLIELLKIDDPNLQHTAAAALRNTVYKEKDIKLDVERAEGIEAILTLFRNTDNIEIQKQLTGLLWNLSSAEELKSELIKDAMPLLTESVLVPYKLWNESSANKLIDPDVFYNTTGCFRNLSSANETERISMRSCPGLIDSLVSYIETSVDSEDKSVENCVCILHNLSYQLEKEVPYLFKQFSVPDEKLSKNNNKKSLFSPKSSKTNKEIDFSATEKGKPVGVDWLYNEMLLQMYRTLLNISQKDAILEACCGALQNLTASKSSLSTLMSTSIIQRLDSLPVISPLLNSGNPKVQKAAMSLVGNMSRVSSLRGAMAEQILPNVSTFLSSVTSKMVNSDSSIATACRVMNTLMLAKPDSTNKVINTELVDSLSMLSTNSSFKTAYKAAGVLLWSMWGQKNIQNLLKKQRMNKDIFINPITKKAYTEAADKKGQ